LLLLAAVGCGGAVFFALCRLCGVDEVRKLWEMMVNRVQRRRQGQADGE
jgi:hypothetical protein